MSRYLDSIVEKKNTKNKITATCQIANIGFHFNKSILFQARARSLAKICQLQVSHQPRLVPTLQKTTISFKIHKNPQSIITRNLLPRRMVLVALLK